MGFIYLASPYTPVNGESIGDRVRLVTIAAAKLMKRGCKIFSPIVHSHYIADHLPEELRLDHEFWMEQDLAILSKADSLWVYKMPGWEKSKGVIREIKFMRDLYKPIYFFGEEFLDGEFHNWKAYGEQLHDTGDALWARMGLPR